MAKLTKFITGGASAISTLPSFLIGLVIIVVLAGGAFGAWRVVSHCSGQSLGACFLTAINPLPASYGRGTGEPLRCADNEEMNAGLCYAKCQAGYKGVGPACWQEPCPAGFRDDGTFCAKPQSYDTGAGYPWKFGDKAFDFDTGPRSRCEADNGKDNCYRSGDIWYPKCRTNFHKVGDLVCSPDCPSGMPDIGVSCTKKSYGRSAGVPIHACADDMDKDGALCYPKCKPGFHGVGPVCWEDKG